MRAEQEERTEFDDPGPEPSVVPLLAAIIEATDAIERYAQFSANCERWEFLRGGERELISYAKRRLIFERDGFCCRNCGMPVSLRSGQLDHIIPWSAKGSDCSCNLRVLCEPCNQARSNFRSGLDDTVNRRPHVVAMCIACANPVSDDDEPEDDEDAPEPDYPVILAYCGTCGVVSPADATMAA